MKRIILSYFLFLSLTGIHAQNTYTQDDAWRDAQISSFKDKSRTAQDRTQWFRDAKLGMFIHWNPSSVASVEISWSKQFYDDNGETLKKNPRPTIIGCKTQEHTDWISWFKPAAPKEVYDNLYKSFYPGMFNADSIVLSAKEAGIKYIVMTSKHHDGFCMFDSKYTDYDIMSTPFKRDVLKEIADACHRHNVRFGIYYSQRDWHHPDYSAENIAKYNEYMRNQIKEILISCAPVSLIFFDAFSWNSDPKIWEPERMFKEIYSIAPDILINNRCGVYGDYDTPEQRIGMVNMERTWESCMTFSGEWSWRGFGNEVIDIDKCFEYIIGCVGGNGNLLMNIDPLPTGQIDPREKTRLDIIGKWMDKHSEAIYGTNGGIFKPAQWGTSTRKKNNIYLLVNRWENFPKYLPNMDFKIKSISVNNKSVPFKKDMNGIEFYIPKWMRDKYVTVIKIETNKDLREHELLNL